MPSKSLENRISKLHIRYCVVPKRNVSMTTNKGLALVKTNKVLITDSDTLFDKQCIKLIADALDKYEVVKPQIIFQNDGSLQSILVANLRTYFNAKNQKMFTPGLAFRMSIKNKIGGYYFELSKLKTSVEKRARLFHPPVDTSHDLAGAFLIGAKKPEVKNLSKIICKRIVTYREILSAFGVLTLLYGLIWYLFFDFGKLTKHAGKIGEKIQRYFWKF